MRRVPTRAALAAASAGLVLTGAAALAGPATAQPAAGAQVAVVSELGEAVASPDGPTTMQLGGSGFQSIEGGFGGIYVLFGWVSGEGWQPSAGGSFGATYRYQPDAAAADNSGYQKFVAFPGSTTQGEANGSTLAADGTWATELVIPGPVLTVTDAAGAEIELDCRVETCGIITMGAHGVVNPNNETFTPVSFEASGGSGGEATAGSGGSGDDASPSAEATAEPSETAATDPSDASEEASGSLAEVEPTEAEDESGGPGAAPWVVAGSAAVAAGGAATTAVVVARRRRAGQGQGQG